MKVDLRLIRIDEKDKLRSMLFNYFSEIDKTKIIQSVKKNEIDYPYLDLYWIEASRLPLFIIYNNNLVGFVLINNWSICENFNSDRSIAEFYIESAYRRRGIGRNVVFDILSTYNGSWEVKQSCLNKGATQFWRNIINNYTNGNYKEVVVGKNKASVIF